MVKSPVQFFLREIRLLSFFLLSNLRHQVIFMDERKLLSNKKLHQVFTKIKCSGTHLKKKEKKKCKNAKDVKYVKKIVKK